MPLEIAKTTCNVCGKEAGLMCQRCTEPYCNDVCQREDWQRHKYYCVVMPPLVTYFGFKRNNAEAKPEIFTIKNMETPLVPLPLSKNWREHLLPPEEAEYFQCRVTAIDEIGTIWVINNTNKEVLESFTEKMIAAMRKRKPIIRIEDVSVDALVGVTVEGKIFRARVLVLHPKLKQAEVCLIDYGPTFTTTMANIYLPLAPMAETKAFAFPVKLSNNNDVVVNKHITIRLLGTRTHGGIYHAQLKPKMTIPLNLPIDLLQANPNVKVVHIFEHDSSSNRESEVVLLQIKALDNLNDDLDRALKDDTAMLFPKPFPEGMTTLFVAASTKMGYRRAFLLDYFEEPTPRYLVYEVDEGRVFITHELRRIPSELMVHPMRVFSLTTAEGCKDSLKVALQSSANDLTIKFKAGISQDKPEDLRPASIRLLGSNGQRICDGRGDPFLVQLGGLGLKYWLEPFTSGQLVFITRVINYDEIYISSVETKNYTAIFRHLEGKCKPFADPKKITVGNIVLVISPTENSFRGEITELLDNGKYAVCNIDTGHEHQVTEEMLRTSCRFIENMPVSLTRIKLKTLHEIPSNVVPSNNAAFEKLSTLKEEEWELDLIDDDCKIADFLSPNDKESLVSKLLPLVFKPATVGEKTRATVGEKTRATVGEKTPATVGEKTPTTVGEKTPATVGEKTRATVGEKTPATVGEKTPTTVGEKTPATVGEKIPAAAKKPPQEEAKIVSEEAGNLPSLPPSPTSSCKSVKITKNTVKEIETPSVKRFYYKDIPLNMIPLGENLEIILLNSVGVHMSGYVTGCYFPNEVAVKKFQDILDLVQNFGEDKKTLIDGYVPVVGEMCATLFRDDMRWYRGVCRELCGDMVKILYFDFGNIDEVPIDWVKPMSADMVKVAYSNKCYIKGFDKSKDFNLVENYLLSQSKLICNVDEGPEPNARYLTIPNLDKILSKEIS